MEKVVATPEELEDAARDFVAYLAPRAESATLVTLSGELGAGKTAFTQAVARTLGVEEGVTSPTFVLEKAYALPERCAFDRLVHIDAYRLNGGAELAPLGFAEVMRDPKTLVLLEWPERVADALPPATIAMTISVEPDNTRRISYAS